MQVVYFASIVCLITSLVPQLRRRDIGHYIIAVSHDDQVLTVAFLQHEGVARRDFAAQGQHHLVSQHPADDGVRVCFREGNAPIHLPEHALRPISHVIIPGRHGLQFLPRKGRVEPDGDFLVTGEEAAGQGFHFLGEDLFDGSGQLSAILDCLGNPPAGKRILVGPAPLEEHGHRTREAVLHLLLGISWIISGDIIVKEGRGVARISEKDGPDRSVRTLGLQHGNGIVAGPLQGQCRRR